MSGDFHVAKALAIPARLLLIGTKRAIDGFRGVWKLAKCHARNHFNPQREALVPVRGHP